MARIGSVFAGCVSAFLVAIVPLPNEVDSSALFTAIRANGEVHAPVYVFVLRSSNEHLHTNFFSEDVDTFFVEMNAQYWDRSGLTWVPRYVEVYHVPEALAEPFAKGISAEEASVHLRTILREALRTAHTTPIVFIVNDFGPLPGNGVYYADIDTAVVAYTDGRVEDTSLLQYALAHELGHVVGLEDVSDSENMMHSGSRNAIPRRERTKLTPQQKQVIREYKQTLY